MSENKFEPNGVLIVHKPQGITSHDVVGKIRKLYGTRKVGHTGTLDPLASGVLPVCVGPATRLDRFMVGHDKSYRVEIAFGCETTTEPEQMTLYDYFEDCLDIEYRCDGRREYRSVRVMVTCGGPNIYIDTATKQVELYWWTDRASYPLAYDAVDAVDAWACEYWEVI